jgi:hypothetical protein
MTRVAVSPELSAWIADRIAAFPTEAAEQIRWQVPDVTQNKALSLYRGWTQTIGIRADGEIINFPSGQPDGMVHLYEVRDSDPTKADYLDDGYYGPHPAD